MCGFSGFQYRGKFPQAPIDVLNKMGEAIFSRGPDSGGVWSCNENFVGFSHRRLAIVDLSPAGHQPMLSRTGRYVIAFNGEIYNHLDLRQEISLIDNIEWNGHSDTETLLAGIEIWGLEATLKKAIGMFAISLWDNNEKALYLARDRFGEKPLYYTHQDNVFLFASELKSIRANPDFTPKISRESISLLIRFNYIPAPYSIYSNVFKLMPGSIALFKNNELIISEYWSIKDSIETKANYSLSDDVAINNLEDTLTNAIKRQMMADVPLGAFLSGGVDSSLIVALMQSISTRPVKTFSIGFNEGAYNEAHFAKEVAQHLGTEHTELYVNPSDALNVVHDLVNIYDEPFADSSQIPTYLVSRMAKEHVSVSLSGDGGDELFCGYNRYLLTNKLWPKLSPIPVSVRKATAKLLLKVPIKKWDIINSALPERFKMSNLGAKLHKAAGVLACKKLDELYSNLVSHHEAPEELVLGSKEPPTLLNDPVRQLSIQDPILKMMAMDTLSYLPDDILVKVDRAAMANSLETRVPFLDHTVFEAAWDLPFNLKLNEKGSKYSLRKILYKYIPRELIERPKTGFGIPLAEWLKGPLEEWANDLLDKDRLVQEGFFDVDRVLFIWEQHKSGVGNFHHLLWSILMFQTWFETHHK